MYSVGVVVKAVDFGFWRHAVYWRFLGKSSGARPKPVK